MGFNPHLLTNPNLCQPVDNIPRLSSCRSSVCVCVYVCVSVSVCVGGCAWVCVYGVGAGAVSKHPNDLCTVSKIKDLALTAAASVLKKLCLHVNWCNPWLSPLPLNQTTWSDSDSYQPWSTQKKPSKEILVFPPSWLATGLFLTNTAATSTECPLCWPRKRTFWQGLSFLTDRFMLTTVISLCFDDCSLASKSWVLTVVSANASSSSAQGTGTFSRPFLFWASTLSSDK